MGRTTLFPQALTFPGFTLSTGHLCEDFFACCLFLPRTGKEESPWWSFLIASNLFHWKLGNTLLPIPAQHVNQGPISLLYSLGQLCFLHLLSSSRKVQHLSKTSPLHYYLLLSITSMALPHIIFSLFSGQRHQRASSQKASKNIKQ